MLYVLKCHSIIVCDGGAYVVLMFSVWLQHTFFQQHNCTTNDANHKYNSRAAQLYREKLHSAAIQAMKIHGTKVGICY